MSASKHFKSTIENYLKNLAENDEQFAAKFQNPEKKIDDCIQYILNTVRKSGHNGFTDDEVYGMAIHYYDEEKIDIGKPININRVVVNHVPELSEEEITAAKEEAKQKLVEETMEKMKAKKKKAAEPKEPDTVQPTLSLFE